MQKTPAVAGNLFLSNFDLRTHSWFVHLKDYSVIEVSGTDAEKFINGQTTNDVLKLENDRAILNARLNHVGKVQSYFYTSKFKNKLYIFVLNELKNSLLEDLNKFIIMDDVELLFLERSLYFLGNHFLDKELAFAGSEGQLAGFTGLFLFEKPSIKEIEMNQLDFYFQMNGFPSDKTFLFTNKFINDSRLNDLAISYKKGCFLGQETVAKIENNRGAAYFPMMLESDRNLSGDLLDYNGNKLGTIVSSNEFNERYFIHVLLDRESRVLDKEIKLADGLIAKVRSYPYFKSSATEIAAEYLEKAISVFHQEKLHQAIEWLDMSLMFHKNSDALEIKGVILGRMEKYNEAIEMMNQLVELDPTSVMAHTNKSLYLMKIGKIAEAEEEKSLATLKSFEKFGEEAKLKKQIELEKKKKEEEMLSREKMFLQVLNIDNEDAIANHGLADINYFRGKYIDALNYIEQAINSNPSYSTAYLLKGKICESLLDNDSAKEVYELGITVATKRGDMMPANEMQSRLNKLKV